MLAFPAPDTTAEVAPSSTTAPEPFPYETTILMEADIEDYPELQFDETIYAEEESVNTVERRTWSTKKCKVIPSDREWPSKSLWAIVNHLTGGGLIETVPLAAPCYKGWHYNSTRCAEITASWTDSDLQYVYTSSDSALLDLIPNLHVFSDEDPTSIMSPFFQGLSCLPTLDPSGSCTLGGYPNYVVKATNVLDVQVAVNFARNSNLRLVVKNTGTFIQAQTPGLFGY